jgi:hypothetical protein
VNQVQTKLLVELQGGITLGAGNLDAQTWFSGDSGPGFLGLARLQGPSVASTWFGGYIFLEYCPLADSVTAPGEARPSYPCGDDQVRWGSDGNKWLIGCLAGKC